MRASRPRLSVKSMTAGVAAFAFGLLAPLEFRDGLPPRFVVQGIPERMGGLSPGMSWEQTIDVLGLSRSWLLGGTGARFFIGQGNQRYRTETYFARPLRSVVLTERVAGGVAPFEVSRSTATIHLSFERAPQSGAKDWRRDKAARLRSASFSSDLRTIAEMPRSR